MNDRSKAPERSTFPLPLSSVTCACVRKPGAPAPVATPQTATLNAAGAVGGPQAPTGEYPLDGWEPSSR